MNKWLNSKTRYGSLSIWLHWIMLLLIATVYACIELRGFFPKGSGLRADLKTWHFMLGLSVLALVVLRIVINMIGSAPEIRPAPPTLQKLLAKLMHFLLYVLMLGVPLAGWLLLSAGGKPIPFFGLELPPLIGESDSYAELFKEIHEAGGTLGYILIAAHAAAALFHHYVVRDNTLQRMLPERS